MKNLANPKLNRMMSKSDWEEGCQYLSAVDPILFDLIRKYPFSGIKPHGRAFETLFRAIVGQQISVIAADKVWQRINSIIESSSPAAIVKADAKELKGCGLSERKIEYAKSLAQNFIENSISDERLSHLPDEEVIQILTRIRGIGRWTSEMFLIFHLARPNILPWDDIGLKKSISRNYKVQYPLSKRYEAFFTTHFFPWSTIAVWYLWRDLDPHPVQY